MADITGVWGTGPEDVFAVGNLGRLLHFDGTTWAPWRNDVGDFYQSVWASASGDVFAVSTTSTRTHITRPAPGAP